MQHNFYLGCPLKHEIIKTQEKRAPLNQIWLNTYITNLTATLIQLLVLLGSQGSRPHNNDKFSGPLMPWSLA